MKTKSYVSAVVIGVLIFGGAVVYAKKVLVAYSSSSPVETTPANVSKSNHPVDHAADYKPAEKTGPNADIIVIEQDFLGQIKAMNAKGEYANKVGIANIMHSMTHQKIKSDRIGFSTKITPGMIDLMIVNIQKSTDLTDHERTDFLSIANRWKSGDFSEVDKDHNFFWTIQDGTIGKATGINSPDEEAAFVEKAFKEGKQTGFAPRQ